MPSFPIQTTISLSQPHREAVRERRQFNIIHVPSDLTLDIIQRKDTDFGALDISSGYRLKSEGFYDACFGSPENVILMKLRYFQEGGSEKHLRDIASILLVQDRSIDSAYISDWARKLGVSNEWTLVRSRGHAPPSRRKSERKHLSFNCFD